LLKPVIVRTEGGAGSGTFEAVRFRLDDLWILECYFDHGFQGCKLFPQPCETWVEPPPGFTGIWATYRVNGQKSHEIHYKDGKRDGVMTSFYEAGSKAVVTHFVAGFQDGDEIGYFPSGKVSYQGVYKTNEMVGTWTWFNEDGTVQSTQKRPIQ
jgi:MORN repeat variant